MLRLQLGEVKQQLAALVTGWVPARENHCCCASRTSGVIGRTLPGAGNHVRVKATSLGSWNRCVKDMSNLSDLCRCVEKNLVSIAVQKGKLWTLSYFFVAAAIATST